MAQSDAAESQPPRRSNVTTDLRQPIVRGRLSLFGGLPRSRREGSAPALPVVVLSVASAQRPWYRGPPLRGSFMRPSEQANSSVELTVIPRREPPFNAPLVVIGLVLVLLAIHAGVSFLSDAAEDAVVRSFAFIPGRLTVALDPSALDGLLNQANIDPNALRQAALLRHFHVLGDGSKFWTLLTYAFLHGNWTHVGLNVIWILAFGPPIARRIGALRFLALFAATAIAGALLHWAFNPLDFTPLIGASAGDSGLMAAATRFVFEPGAPLGGAGYSRSIGVARFNAPAPRLTKLLRERRVLIFLAIWFAANFIFGAGAQTIGLSEGPVAWIAHIGGFAAGLLAFPLFDRRASSMDLAPPTAPSAEIE
jgi:membrane associated rhomboid family serine protease